MFQDVQNLFRFSLNFGDVLVNISIALVCGFLISLFYRSTYRGPNYSTTFVNSMIILAMITAIVIMVIGNNLARAFGLVGAMSIIRFRTAIKDTQDIVFIFFALSVGMAAGVGLHTVALGGTIFIGFIIWLLYKTDYANPRRKEFLLQFTATAAEEGESGFIQVFRKYCKSQDLVNLKTFSSGTKTEFTYYVRLKQQEESAAFVKEMNRVPEIEQVNLFFDEEQF